MIVADTNLVAYFVIPGAQTPEAERVRAKDKEWMVPPLLRFELLNVIGKELRANHLSRDAALRTFRRGMNLVTVTKLQSDPLYVFNPARQRVARPMTWNLSGLRWNWACRW